MQVVGQYNDGVYLKRMPCSHLMKRTPQQIDLFHEKAVAVPTRQSDCEEPRGPRHARSAVVSHCLPNTPSLASSNDAVRASPHPTALGLREGKNAVPDLRPMRSTSLAQSALPRPMRFVRHRTLRPEFSGLGGFLRRSGAVRGQESVSLTGPHRHALQKLLWPQKQRSTRRGSRRTLPSESIFQRLLVACSRRSVRRVYAL